MKELVLLLAGLGTAVIPTSAHPRNNLEGRRKNGAMEIVIAPCGHSLCGRVVKASSQQQSKAERGSGTHLLGARVIDNIEAVGPGTWRANLFVASRNMNARGTIEQVAPDRLEVHGCVLAVICKTTHWDRIG